MLEIKNLHVSVENNKILRGLDLSVKAGEVHAIMGPNGSGKSTLSYVLAGREGYDILDGTMMFAGADLSEMEPEERAAAGLFLAFQYPVEVPGVVLMTFLKTALHAQYKLRGEKPLDTVQFLKYVRAKTKALGIDPDMLKRSLNTGFSGGEKKRNEILQLSLFAPKLAILDETDSGLDIDALKIVAEGVNALRSPERSFVIITHYQRLLEYIIPDHVHVLAHGKIIKSGDKTLAQELENSGYGAFLEQAA